MSYDNKNQPNQQPNKNNPNQKTGYEKGQTGYEKGKPTGAYNPNQKDDKSTKY